MAIYCNTVEQCGNKKKGREALERSSNTDGECIGNTSQRRWPLSSGVNEFLDRRRAFWVEGVLHRHEDGGSVWQE